VEISAQEGGKGVVTDTIAAVGVVRPKLQAATEKRRGIEYGDRDAW
jgi:hypothetical protein